MEIDIKKVRILYRKKASDSFKTRLELLLFSLALKGEMGEVNEDDLQDFKIEEQLDLLRTYTFIYWQHTNLDTALTDLNNQSVNSIYTKIKDWKDVNKPQITILRDQYIKEIFKEVFPFEDFKEFIASEKKVCHYCHTNEQQINQLISNGRLRKKHITRGWGMEIDRLKPNHEYNEKNCVWSCYWCNNAKTDEFNEEEFMKIGKVIKSIWKDRESRSQDPI